MSNIKVEITNQMLVNVKNFSEEVLDETYDRFSKDEKTRFLRIFVGKLGEYCVSKYLDSLKIPHDTSKIFEIFPGTTNVDSFDLIVPHTQELIDVKTAYKNFHTRILIPYGPYGQWQQMPKDYYIGVKLFRLPIEDEDLNFSLENQSCCLICGYISRNDPKWKGPRDFGEDPCMWVFLNELQPIHKLIKMINS